MSAAKRSRKDAGAPVVVLEGASRAFGARQVLSNVDLVVHPGELVALVGPNGGGKSTLLNLMAGLLKPTAGRVQVCGVEAYQLSLTATGRVGLVTARPGLYPLLTGRENLLHFGELFGLSEKEVNSRAEALGLALGLGAGFDERAGRLSTGTQQKLSLIRALLTSPDVLLLDEPTANLDPVASRALHAEVRKRADAGLSCIIATHDLPAAEAICDRALLVERGIKRELVLDQRRVPPAGPLLAAWQEALGAR